jgi:hypothetical protein
MKNKATTLLELGALGHENKAKEERIKITEKRRETKANTKAVEYLDKMIALNISPFANALRINYFLKIVIPMIWIASLAMAYPYFVFFMSGETVDGFDYKSSSHWTLNPAVDGYGLFWPFAILTTGIVVYGILWLIATANANSFKKEFAWLKTLPFPILGYPGVLESDSRNRFEISIHYMGRPPENLFVDNVIRGLNKEIAYDRRYVVDLLKIDFSSEWSPSSKSGFKFHKLLHLLSDRVLVPLHDQYPINQIRVKW